MDYQQFLDSKKVKFQESGFDINESELNPALFPFQKFIVQWALKKGKAALFEDCGLGKTIQQLEWANQIVKRENAPVLVLTPLAVNKQTLREAEKFNIPAYKWIDNESLGNAIYVINYEQLDNIDCSRFVGVVLDESSILKNFTGKYKKQIIENFSSTPYKLACTATPSPNDHMELGNHSEFLNIMKSSEMLARWFVHDSAKTQDWRLKKHAEKDFWNWVSSWAMCISSPSDIGFHQEGYKLPGLNFIDHAVEVKLDDGKLFSDSDVSAVDFNRALRASINERADITKNLVNGNNEQWLIWVNLNEEADLIKSLIPDAVEVRGDEKVEIKESKLLGFANGEHRVLVTKKKIASFGLNFQNCHNQIFMSLDFSFEGLYQAIRRSYRFGQDKSVNIHMITSNVMGNVLETIKRKQAAFDRMQHAMSQAISENFNIEIRKENKMIENANFETENSKLILGDSCQEVKKIPDSSIDFSIFSPPFAELYVYSGLNEDLGNSRNYKEFFNHFNFLSSELYRILKPGRLMAVHCVDLTIQKGKEGYIGLRDFSGMLIRNFQRKGFIYHNRVTVWKDPVVEMQRTKALGLLHKQLRKDSAMSRVGNADYILVFRKDGENENPIKANENTDVDTWQKWASPVWMDIVQGDTLNREQAREDQDEKHICPLQLDLIERCIQLWSNPGDIVFSPFMGIGSEGYQAIKQGRKFIGIELKQSYFDIACKNIQSAETEKNQLSLLEI